MADSEIKTNPEDQGLFAPIVGDETEYIVAKRTLSSYEKIKRLAVESSNYSSDDKLEICREMGWDYDKVASTKYNFRQNTYQLCQILFEGFTMKKDMDIDLPTVERAYVYFLTITRR